MWWFVREERCLVIVHTRTITLDDYQKIIQFWKKNYPTSRLDDLKRFQIFLSKNPDLSILIEKDGEIIGTALGSYDGLRGYLQKVVIRKDLRKSGMGRILVDEVAKRLKKVGALYIPLSVENNLAHFYEKCGFVKKASISMTLDL